MMTSKTLYVLVTCSLEQSRHQALEATAKNVADCFSQKDLLVVDNGSTIVETRDLLTKSFNNVVFLDKNYGYWSAVNYALQNRSVLSGDYKYVYVIESDEIHYAAHKLHDCEEFLNLHPECESIRTQEFSVAQSHLYDKTRPRHDSRRWAWTRLDSVFFDCRVTFEHAQNINDSSFYWCKLPPQVCALNTLNFMDEAFAVLSNMTAFEEKDFQKVYFDRHAQTGLLDGGAFNCMLHDPSKRSSTISGSFSSEEKLRSIKYVSTRRDRIVQIAPKSVNTITRQEIS